MERDSELEYKYKLVRTKDNLTRYGDTRSWIGWNKEGTFKEQYEEPTVGASLVLGFSFGDYVWMTTRIVSFKEEENCHTFTTQNSEYKLYQL
jgi:hypothetical protein